MVMVPDPSVAFEGALTSTVAPEVAGTVTDAGRVTVTLFVALAESETVPEKFVAAKLSVS
jgi:hypothetical protein